MSQKVFINVDDTATFKCPQCERTKTADVSEYKTSRSAVRVNCKCPCGHAYTVLLERRKYIRKNLNLNGIYHNLGNDIRGRLKIMDMSRSGLRLEVSDPTDFKSGDCLKLTFKLSDKEQTTITREVYVRTIKDKYIGVEFESIDHYDKLGAFILYTID